MKLFIGTSGWYYEWNKDKTLDWYINNSGLNAIELNASFYRFPYPNMIKSWSRKGTSLHWSIKVNRLITHLHKFNENALDTWYKFRNLFKPLDRYVDFYLFQAPPNFTDTDRVLNFAKETKLGNRFALELRNKKILNDLELCKKLMKKLTLVSIDSPDFHNKIFADRTVYLRLHGKTVWYQHNYSKHELKIIVNKIKDINPNKVYIFFNNNHNMLNNARDIMRMIRA